MSASLRGFLIVTLIAVLLQPAQAQQVPSDTTQTRPSEPASKLDLKKGDRVVIVGDSITGAKVYSRYLECYFIACVPQLELWTMQLGWGGEQARGFLTRIDRDLIPLKPSVVTVLYGMNDGGYSAFNADAVGRYYPEAMRTIIQKSKAAGARVIVASPSVVDSKYFVRIGTTAEVYNQTLARLGTIGRTLAAENDVVFADVHDVMAKAMLASKAKYGEDYPVAGRDGVHPLPNGHIPIAYAFLKSMGLDGRIGAITVDMADKGEASDGHKVLSSAPGTLELESTRYPFCFFANERAPESSPRSMLPFVPFQQDFNQLTLVVKGLKSDKAKVTWGQQSQSFTREQLTAGINLAAEFLDNPFSEAFKKLDEEVAKKQEFEEVMIRNIYATAGAAQKALDNDEEVIAATNVLAAKARAKHDTFTAAVRAAVVPVKHAITVTEE